jgi:biotin-(acetyl-CoA carboxylase) ligase
VLEALFEWRPKLLEETLHSEWEKRLAYKEDWVRVEESCGASITGQVVGLDDSGSLLLRTQAGEQIKIAVGDVHLRLME